jgi:hypothetical protein
MAYLLGYGAYLPYNRLRRDDIAAVPGVDSGRGQRTRAADGRLL